MCVCVIMFLPPNFFYPLTFNFTIMCRILYSLKKNSSVVVKKKIRSSSERLFNVRQFCTDNHRDKTGTSKTKRNQFFSHTCDVKGVDPFFLPSPLTLSEDEMTVTRSLGCSSIFSGPTSQITNNKVVTHCVRYDINVLFLLVLFVHIQ